MPTIKPFARAGYYTVLDNLLLDWLMPRLAPASWKVFCFLYRQTRGYHRERIGCTYRDIRDGTGIGSDATVSRALKALDGMGLTERMSGEGSGANTYGLNLDWAVEVEGDVYRRVDDADAVEASTTPTIDAPLPPGEAPETLRDVFDALRQQVRTTRADRVQALLRDTCSFLYNFTPTYKAVGGWKKQHGGAGRALNLLLAYCHCDVRGNPLHYIAAAEARKRRGEDPPPPDLAHLDRIGVSERTYYINERGYDPDAFKRAGHDEKGNRMWRYLSPDPQTDE